MNFIIRKMQLTDINAIYAIELNSHRAPWGRDILSDCVLIGYDCQVLECLIDNDDKKIVGYIISRFSFNLCHILNLCICFSEKGQGYGTVLLNTFLDSLDRSVIDTAILEVRPSNIAALNLYKKFGFSEAGIKKSFYKDATSDEDAILLKKILS